MLGLVVAILATGCASLQPLLSPSPTPIEPAETVDPAADRRLLLRYEEGSGGEGVILGFEASRGPLFSLYGDGAAIYQPSTGEPSSQAASGAWPQPAYRIVRLSLGQVREVLAVALDQGGLRDAEGFYPHPGIADAGTATFIVDAQGLFRLVRVVGLGLEDGSPPNAAARQTFLQLAEYLRDLERRLEVEGADWLPERFRGSLLTDDGLGLGEQEPRAWPWPELQPEDFRRGAGDDGLPWHPHRTMTRDEVAVLDLEGAEGGAWGILLRGPAGGQYGFALRPIFPDDPEASGDEPS